MFERSDKQKQAWDMFLSSDVRFIGYGGAGGGGKSYLGCDIFSTLCATMPNSKWFFARNTMMEVRDSMVHTWRKVCGAKGLKGWRVTDKNIIFINGSTIDFLELQYYPRIDPLYERLGSKEYTGGWIEEAGNVHPLAFDVLKSKVGRWMNEEFGLAGKILVTFNPKKNWLYHTFYKPYRDNEETSDTKFIPALYSDNPWLPKEYIENLRNIKDKATKERLLRGNFDYDDDPTALIPYEKISAIWSNTHIKKDYANRYITADIARYGSDKAIIMVWYGFVIVDVAVFDTSSMVDIQNTINSMRSKHGIPARNCIADEDGIGGGIVDNCGINGFVNNGRPFDSAYYNLKCECAYYLAKAMGSIYFEVQVSEDERQCIEEELGQIKTYQADTDTKLRILPKEKVKENIGHSPDWADNFIMRMLFELGETFDAKAFARHVEMLI